MFTDLDDGMCYAHAGYRSTTPATDGAGGGRAGPGDVPLGDDELCAAATSLTTAALDRLSPPS